MRFNNIFYKKIRFAGLFLIVILLSWPVNAQVQKEKKGLAWIEVVSNCNSGWKLPPVKSNEWMEEHMFPFYPLGDIKLNGELVK